MNNNKIPCDIVFHPNWWHKNYGMIFNEDYFFDPQTRIATEQKHRQILFERFGDLGLGEQKAEMIPVLGPVHIAAGFVISAVLGCKINFYKNNPPEVVPLEMTEDEVMSLKAPDVVNTYPMNKILSMMDVLEKEYGYITGDINWQGLLNVALDLRGQNFLMDYYINPGLVNHLLNVIYKTTLQVVNLIKTRSGSSSMAVNRIVGRLDKSINMHSNCSVTMISKDTYDEFHLPWELKLAERLYPYAIHHCGNDMEKVAESYARTNAVLYDVGWGSDIAACRKALPESILSIRIDPAKMKIWTTDDVKCEVNRCITASRNLNRTALCCVNMDADVPDENVRELFEVAKVGLKKEL